MPTNQITPTETPKGPRPITSPRTEPVEFPPSPDENPLPREVTHQANQQENENPELTMPAVKSERATATKDSDNQKTNEDAP